MADRIRRTRCDPCGKWSHADGIAAALRSSRRFGIAFRSYPCPHGHGAHLTTKPLRSYAPTTQEDTQP